MGVLHVELACVGVVDQTDVRTPLHWIVIVRLYLLRRNILLRNRLPSLMRRFSRVSKTWLIAEHARQQVAVFYFETLTGLKLIPI